MKPIDKSWISDGISQATMDWAKEQGQFFAEGRDKLTTTQLRKFFGELKRIQALGYDNAKADFLLLQAKLAYAVGRERKRGGRVGKIEDFADMISRGIQEVNSKKEYQNFIDITESVVAYHKFYEEKN
jgi:CRISPR type III-A-associated protein Csm2